MITDSITDIREQFVVLRWDIFEGFYFVGPFPTVDAAADWGAENEGTNIYWQVERLDPTVPLAIKPPGAIPELAPEDDDDREPRWADRPDDPGDFFLLMITNDLHLIGPFVHHRDAYAWAREFERRTDDEGWQVVWLTDASATPRLLTPEEGEIEIDRSDATWRATPEAQALLRQFEAAATVVPQDEPPHRLH
jgi:hypothetical protein